MSLALTCDAEYEGAAYALGGRIADRSLPAEVCRCSGCVTERKGSLSLSSVSVSLRPLLARTLEMADSIRRIVRSDPCDEGEETTDVAAVLLAPLDARRRRGCRLGGVRAPDVVAPSAVGAVATSPSWPDVSPCIGRPVSSPSLSLLGRSMARLKGVAGRRIAGDPVFFLRGCDVAVSSCATALGDIRTWTEAFPGGGGGETTLMPRGIAVHCQPD